MHLFNETYISGYDVFQMANSGDKIVLEIIDKFTCLIASMIINLQLIYDPDKFVIGGGISKQRLFIEYINKNIDLYNSISNFMLPKANISTCKFYNDSNLIGAYTNFIDKFNIY